MPADVLSAIEATIARSGQIGIAVSGGADSVFLLRWLLSQYPEYRHLFRVLHFNHKTRGSDSDSDALFVEKLCADLDVQKEFDARRGDESSDKQDEASLRMSRLDFFRRARKKHNLELLLTAHHKQDRVETLLMRLSRASALEGLVAPKSMTTFRDGLSIGRPLLTCSKSQMLAALQAAGQPWREDHSNQDTAYYRNFIRNRLIPVWEERNPGQLVENIAQSVQFLEEDAQVLNDLAEQAVEYIDLSGDMFPIQQVQGHPQAIQRRCVWMWLNSHGYGETVSHRQVQKICNLRFGDTLTIASGWQVAASENGNLYLVQSTRSPASFESLKFGLGSGSQLIFPDGKTLSAEQIPLSSDLYKQITNGEDDPDFRVHIDLDALKGAHLTVRFWESGMRYTPLGFHSNNSKKIKSCFIDRKIDATLRKRLPVVCDQQGDILWIPGLLPAEKGRVTVESKILLRLTYQ